MNFNRRVGWTCVIDHGCKRVFVRDDNVEIFRSLQKYHHQSFYWTEIYRAFYGIRGNPQGGTCVSRDATIRRLSFQGGEIEYYLDNGDILINRFSFGKAAAKGASGLYPASHSIYEDGKRWGVIDEVEPIEKLAGQWNGEYYATVSDDAGSRSRTAFYMGDHLFAAYKDKVHKATIEAMSNPPSFSLYYIPEAEYKHPEHGSRLAAIIQQATESQQPVNWLVHGHGAIGFESALTSLKNTPAINRLKTSNVPQYVFFSSPVGTNIHHLDKLVEEVGLKRYGDKGFNNNPYYLKSSYISGNAFAEIFMAARLAKTEGAGGAKQLYKGFVAAINNPVLSVGLAGSGIAASASGLIDQSLAKTLGVAVAIRTTLGIIKSSQTIVDGFQALKHSNSGMGHFYFYENPSQLMKAVKGGKPLMENK